MPPARSRLLSVLTLCSGVARRLDQLMVSTIGVLQRQGTFAQRGYRSPVPALADLLGWEPPAEARRYVLAADQLTPRVGLDGTPIPAQLPATAERFNAGRIGLRHADVIASLLNRPEARHLTRGEVRRRGGAR